MFFYLELLCYYLFDQLSAKLTVHEHWKPFGNPGTVSIAIITLIQCSNYIICFVCVCALLSRVHDKRSEIMTKPGVVFRLIIRITQYKSILLSYELFPLFSSSQICRWLSILKKYCKSILLKQ